MMATATNMATQPTSAISELNFITDIGSSRCSVSIALRVGWPDPCGRTDCCGRGGRPAPGCLRAGAVLGLGLGLGFVLVIPENEAPTLDARPRAPLAAPATTAIGEVEFAGEVEFEFEFEFAVPGAGMNDG